MADNLTLALKIKTDLKNALTDIKTLERELQQTSTAGAKLGQNAGTGAKGLDNLGKSADTATNKLGKTRASVESISKQLERLQRYSFLAGGGLFAVNSLSNLARTADEFNNYEARVRLVSKSNQHAESTFKALMQTANDTGQLFGATAELYTRVYRAMGSAVNGSDLLQFTKTINQSMVVSGASAQEANAAIIQLSQGMAAGALRGEEFNSVAEQAPIILEVLQKHLGKTRGELRKMAEEGKLTTGVILAAVNGSTDEIQAQYDQMPKTIGRAVNELSNAWMQFVGTADNAVSASSIVAGTISLLAKNLTTLGNVALLVGPAIGVGLAGSLIKQQYALVISNNTMVARAAIEVKAAQSALAMARATDMETAAVARLTAANRALVVAKGAAVAGGLGSGLMAFVGGPVGLAITAVMGLVAAYSYLKGKEEELEAQYRESAVALQDNLDKTQALLEARQKAAEVQTYTEVKTQETDNINAIAIAQQQLDALKAQREALYQSLSAGDISGGLFNSAELEQYDLQINALTASIGNLTAANQTLSEITRNQLNAAFEAAIAAGGEFADKLQLLMGLNPEEAIRLLTESIKESETELLSMGTELDNMEQKLRQELADATMTATQQLEAMRGKMEALAKSAGWSAEQLNPFIAQLDLIISLQNQVANAKQAKTNESFFDNISKRARQSGMSAKERMIDDIKNQAGATPEQIAQGIKDAEKIYANEGRGGGRSRRSGGGSRSTKDQAAENEQKNLELNIQYLRLTGQEVKANLTDVESRYNRMIAEFQKAGNVDGINLIKKILPLEQAKVQIDGVQAEINKLYQNLSAQEQKINAQVQTGLISHLEGQRQLKDVYAQTVEEIEKQLPLLERLAKMPGAQGEQARVMMEQMKLKITELKSAGNDLEKAFKDGLTQGIQSSLMGLVQGTMSLKDAIKNLALTVVNSMAQIAAQQLAMQAVSSMSSWWGAAGSAVGGAVMAASGGYIRGPGTSTSDSIPAKLSDGEFVVNAAMVRRYGVDFLHSINRGHLRKFSSGGLVSAPTLPSYWEPGLTQEMREGKNEQQAPPQVNIRQTLAVDSAELFAAGINTVAGERAVLTVIRANKDTLKQELS